jgi:hypothetical protein
MPKKQYTEKIRARIIVREAVRIGNLTRLACEVCGDPKSHGHHDDYAKPLEVRWLCAPHHREHHNTIRLLTAPPRVPKQPKPRGRKLIGDKRLTNAEVQARWRAKRAAEAEAMQAEIRRLSDELRQRKNTFPSRSRNH